MPHKVIIMAQGSGKRWDIKGVPFLGKPKHLTIIDGETLLGRARRLFTEAGCDVVVIGPNAEGYNSDVTLDTPLLTGYNMDKFYVTRPYWSVTDRTIIVWGDVYYTEDCVRKITTHQDDSLHYFRRPTSSKVTGHRWDESFAVSFGPKEHDEVIAIADLVLEKLKSRELEKDHIRSHYAAFLGLKNFDTVSGLLKTPHQTIIDDWSDDFDSPDEWTRWVGRYYANKIPIFCAAPYRKSNDIEREVAKDFVYKKYSEYGVKTIYGTCDSTMFNRSASRNAAIREGFKDPEKRVAFVIDTDCYVSSEQMWAACYLADLTGRLVIAFTTWDKLSRTETLRVINGGVKNPAPFHTRHGHASCALAVPRSLWEKIGGFDERFPSWGAEDRAFYYACNVMMGEVHALRLPGSCFHLFHPISPEVNKSLPEYQANVKLGMRYKHAAGISRKEGCILETKSGEPNRDLMISIMKEDGGPLDPKTKPLGRIATSDDIETRDLINYKSPRGRFFMVEKGSEKEKEILLEIEAGNNWEIVDCLF